MSFKSCAVLLSGLMLLLVTGCGGGNGKAAAESSQNLKILSMAIIKFQEDNQTWPESLNDLQPIIGTDYAGEKIGGDKDFASIVKNPITGDDTGYEYVQPPETPESYASTVVLYQLRDGKRDETLSVAYLDGSVRKVGE